MRILIVVMLSLCGLLIGCGNPPTDSGVETSILAFNEAYNAGDYTTCLSYMDGWQSSDKDYIISVLKMARQLAGPTTIISVTDVKITGNTATAQVSSSWINPTVDGKTSGTSPRNLRNVAGKWKLIFE